MANGMRLDSEQLREMPLHMQEQVGVALVNQMAQAVPVAGREEKQPAAVSVMKKCDPRVYARCLYNSMCLSPPDAEFPEGSDCDLFSKRVMASPETEADHIRGMSDPQLYLFLYTVTRSCRDQNCTACPIGPENCQNLRQWLKQKKVEES